MICRSAAAWRGAVVNIAGFCFPTEAC